MTQLTEGGKTIFHNAMQLLHPPHIRNAVLRGIMYRATHVKAAFQELEKLEEKFRKRIEEKEQKLVEVPEEDKVWYEQVRKAYEYAALFNKEKSSDGRNGRSE